MIDETFFTVNEVAKAFKVSEKKVRKWILEGTLKGHLLDGFVEHHTDAEALVEFQENHHRYQKAVSKLLDSRNVEYWWVEEYSCVPSVTLKSLVYAFWKNPGYAVKTWKIRKERRKQDTHSNRRLILCEDWEPNYDVYEELERRYEILKEYRRELEQKYDLHLNLKKVKKEMGELEAILNE